MNTIRGVCFDLDGTLLDTLEEIGVSANTVLERFGYSPHPLEDYRYHVGDGVRRLVERILPSADSEESRVLELAQELEREYHRRANRLTKIYPGIESLLTELGQRDISRAVLSNKPHALTQECMQRFFPTFKFVSIMGQQPGVPRKPDPTSALKTADELGLSPAEILYVGDTDVDMKTAVGAGMIPVGVLWGFRTREELETHGAAHIVETPRDILSLLSSSK